MTSSNGNIFRVIDRLCGEFNCSFRCRGTNSISLFRTFNPACTRSLHICRRNWSVLCLRMLGHQQAQCSLKIRYGFLQVSLLIMILVPRHRKLQLKSYALVCFIPVNNSDTIVKELISIPTYLRKWVDEFIHMGVSIYCTKLSFLNFS